MLRSATAIVAGYFVTAVLVLVLAGGAVALLDVSEGDSPPAYLALNLLGNAVAGIAGGFTTARIARDRRAVHVGVLALLLFALSLPGVFDGPAGGQPSWYPAAIAVLGPAAVVIGGVWAWSRRPEPAAPVDPAEHPTA